MCILLKFKFNFIFEAKIIKKLKFSEIESLMKILFLILSYIFYFLRNSTNIFKYA